MAQQPLLGGKMYDDSTVAPAEVQKGLYKAAAAIGLGVPVMIDITDTTGLAVVVATAAASNRAIGVFAGQGGPTGTPASAALIAEGFTGRSAVTGDMIRVVRQGMVIAKASPSTTQILPGNELVVGADGKLTVIQTASANGIYPRFLAIETLATSTVDGYITVYVSF